MNSRFTRSGTKLLAVLVPLVGSGIFVDALPTQAQVRAHGQVGLDAVDDATPTPQIEEKTQRGSTFLMVLAGAGAGAVAALAGWYAAKGANLPVEGSIVAAAALESVFLPVGMHVANRQAGDLTTGIVVSAGLASAGTAYVMYHHTDASLREAAMIVPVVQLTMNVWIQRRPHR